mmetsp:Transcript_38779/g.34472  ORF Transcript_38779/g.34472 Transcript_38779/m.34472 type:complete len:257 (+) Transcript_38779:1669-2439(+)
MVNEGYKRLAKMTEEKKQMVMNQLGVKKKSTKKSTVTGDLDQELLPKDEDGKFPTHRRNMSNISGVGSEIDFYEEEDAEEKLIIESRNRFILALKAEYYTLFELSQCGPDAFLLLKESADWDLDTVHQHMNSWDLVSSHFMNPTYISILFFFKKFPIFGRYAKNNLFNHLSFVYDVVTNYLNALETVESIAYSFPFHEDIIRVVVRESEEQRNLAEVYLNNYLNVSFPEIQKSIQIKKAAFSILNSQKQYLNQTYE